MACQTCEIIRLATGPTCEVQACTCGVVHLTSGGLSLRLTAEAFLGIATTIEHAAMKLIEEHDKGQTIARSSGMLH